MLNLEKSEMLNEEMKEWQTFRTIKHNNETEGQWKEEMKTKKRGKGTKRRSAMVKRRRNYELEKQTTHQEKHKSPKEEERYKE